MRRKTESLSRSVIGMVRAGSPSFEAPLALRTSGWGRVCWDVFLADGHRLL